MWENRLYSTPSATAPRHRPATTVFAPSSQIHHTHEGSIGNLCNEQISASMNAVLAQFGFEKVNKAIEDLIA